MPDWRKLVRERLTPLGLEAKRQEDIVAEISGHLEDLSDDLVRQGNPEEDAIRLALGSISDWNDLRFGIEHAAREEDVMNHRVKALWLPGALTISLSSILLGFLQRVLPQPHVFWLWRGSFVVLYWQWLLCLPLVGALGAYLSQRADGGPVERALAASFPASGPSCVMAFTFAAGALVIDRQVPFSLKIAAFAAYMMGWCLLPACASLLGALPFLRQGAGEPRKAAIQG